MSDLTMKQVFDRFNKAGRAPIGKIGKEKLITHKKTEAILQMARMAENNLKKKAGKIFDEFNVGISITLSDDVRPENDVVQATYFRESQDKKELNVKVDFNFEKLCSLPAEEAYAIIYSSIYVPLLNKYENRTKSNDVVFDKEENLSNEAAVNDANVDRDGHYSPTTSVIVKYLKKFLKLLFEDEFGSEKDGKDFDFSNCARSIEQDFKSNGITENDLFENPHGVNLLAERYGKVVKQDNNSQATRLLGVFSKQEFASLKTGNMQDIRNFCEKYAKTILEQSGINASLVPITFNPVGSMGEYIDYGNRQSVNINLNEVRAMKNPAEVVMILQHELTHAIDSTKNKSEGNVTKEGYGLQENLVGNLENIDKNIFVKNESDRGVVQNYFQRLSEMCYRLNPNERSARQGELAAIEFMQCMTDDKTMKDYINKSIDSYNKYQNLVIQDMNNIQNIQNEYVTKIQSMIDRGGVTDRLIVERLNYLNSLNFVKFNEKQAIQTANEIKQQIEQQQQGD